MYLLSVGSDVKTVKSNEYGFLTGILYLSPYKLSGVNFCSSASPGCIESCLNTAGMGAFNTTQKGRLRKSKLFIEDKEEFFRQLRKDLIALGTKAKNKGLKPAVRLNGTSDLPWENLAFDLMSEFKTYKFYDYTKVFNRMMKFLEGKMPKNYHLTFSKSEKNYDKCLQVLENGGNVTAVFDKVPKKYQQIRVIQGDKYDCRFIDPKPVWVGLTAKGKAKKDTSGFVIKV